jgi:hypothetical protein
MTILPPHSAGAAITVFRSVPGHGFAKPLLGGGSAHLYCR